MTGRWLELTWLANRFCYLRLPYSSNYYQLNTYKLSRMQTARTPPPLEPLQQRLKNFLLSFNSLPSTQSHIDVPWPVFITDCLHTRFICEKPGPVARRGHRCYPALEASPATNPVCLATSSQKAPRRPASLCANKSPPTQCWLPHSLTLSDISSNDFLCVSVNSTVGIPEQRKTAKKQMDS